MELLPLSSADLSKTDAELGEWVVTTWLGFQAEKAGIPLHHIPHEWAVSIIEATTQIDSDSLENAALESIFRKACNGDYKTAGKMLRAYLHGGAFQQVKEKYAIQGIKQAAGKKKGGDKTGEAKKADAEKWHERCVNKAHELIALGKSPRELAGILSPVFGVTPTTIRTVLKKAKVK